MAICIMLPWYRGFNGELKLMSEVTENVSMSQFQNSNLRSTVSGILIIICCLISNFVNTFCSKKLIFSDTKRCATNQCVAL